MKFIIKYYIIKTVNGESSYYDAGHSTWKEAEDILHALESYPNYDKNISYRIGRERVS